MFGQLVRLQVSVIIFIFLSILFPPHLLFSQTNIYKKSEEKTDELFQMSLEELMNVKITTAGKIEEKVSEIPASVVVITREQIERYGYSSVSEILENVPGLYAVDNRSAQGEIFGVRGFWTGKSRNVIILVNDVDQADSEGVYHMQNFNLPVEVIDRIEVVRGPMSIMYGSGAFFGAINIFTNKSIHEDSQSLISSSFGSEKTKKAALRYAYNDDYLKFVFNAGYYDTYGPNEPLSKMVSNMTPLMEFGISEANNNTSTDGRLENNNAYFNFSGKYKGFFADFSLNRSAREEYHYWPSFSDGLLHKKRFTTVSFGYEKELSTTLSIKGAFKYYLASYWREFDYFINDFYGQEIQNSVKYEIELHTVFKPSENFNILTGFNFKEKDTVDKLDIRTQIQISTGTYTNNIRNLALFTQANYSPIDRLRLVGGVRLEKLLKYSLCHQDNETSFEFDTDYEIKKIELVPRFALIYSINEKHVLKFLYGKAVKFPTYIDVVQQKLRNAADLAPEYINTLELNYIATLSPKFSVNVSLFHNILDNLIVTAWGFNEQEVWAPKATNSGKMITDGAELMIYAKPIKNFLLELSGTYQETKDKREGFEGRDVEYSPNLLGYIKVSYSFNPDITLAMTGKYVSEMETLWDISKDNPTGAIGGGSRIAKKVDGYFTMDCNFRINDLFGKGYFINLKCSNIFDTEYLYPLYTGNSGWADKGTFGNGRSFLVTIGKKF